MKELNLYRIWEIMNRLSDEQCALDETNCYVYFLGVNSNYFRRTFDSFLDYYSFKFEKDNIVVYNDDGIPYEDYTNDDYSYVPICLLSFSAEKIENWIEEETENQLKQQEKDREEEQKRIKAEIERLKKRLI